MQGHSLPARHHGQFLEAEQDQFAVIADDCDVVVFGGDFADYRQFNPRLGADHAAALAGFGQQFVAFGGKPAAHVRGQQELRLGLVDQQRHHLRL